MSISCIYVHVYLRVYISINAYVIYDMFDIIFLYPVETVCIYVYREHIYTYIMYVRCVAYICMCICLIYVC